MRTGIGFVCGVLVGVMAQQALGAGVPDIVSLNPIALSVEHLEFGPDSLYRKVIEAWKER